MAGIDDEFFDEDAVVAEGRLGLGLGELESFRNFRPGMRNPHALAATAGGRLDHHGIADLVGDLHGLLVVVDDAEMARHRGNLGLGGGLLGFDLVAHRGDGTRIGSDEDDPGFGKRARKGLALGQESVTGVHGLRARLLAGFNDFIDEQIALGRGRRADQHGFIGHLDMERVAVGLGIDRYRRNSHAAGRLDHPAGDLAAICDQNSFEHVFLA